MNLISVELPFWSGSLKPRRCVMINLDKYFSVWKQRLSALRAANDKIKVLPKEAQFIQALIVRNACTDFVTELESGFESILADYVSRQDELFLAAVDNIHWTAFTEKIRPPDLGLQEQKKALTADVSKWAVQAAELKQVFCRCRPYTLKWSVRSLASNSAA